MKIGDYECSPDRALALLVDYARTYGETVRLYDLAGKPDGQSGPRGAADPVDAVTLADMGRLVVINAGLDAGDVVRTMNVDAAAEFAAVPPTARLQDCEPGGDLYQAATSLYEKYRFARGSNIGQAKRSKLLHLKRPWLVPIADSRVMGVYRRRADARAAELGVASGHWEVARDDLRDSAQDFEWLTARLSESDDPAVHRMGRLTSLRLLDVIAWMASDN